MDPFVLYWTKLITIAAASFVALKVLQSVPPAIVARFSDTRVLSPSEGAIRYFDYGDGVLLLASESMGIAISCVGGQIPARLCAAYLIVTLVGSFVASVLLGLKQVDRVPAARGRTRVTNRTSVRVFRGGVSALAYAGYMVILVKLNPYVG